MITNLKRSNLNKIVDEFHFNENIRGVLYDPDDETIVATDGIKLVIFENVIKQKGDIRCILPLDVFPLKVKKHENFEYTFKDGIVQRKGNDGLILHSSKIIQKEFPKYKNTIPTLKDFEHKEISFDIKNLLDTLNSIQSVDKDERVIDISFIANNKPVKFCIGDVKGIVMPMRSSNNKANWDVW